MRDPRRNPPPGHGAHTLRVWTGTVVGIHGDDVFVELGPRMQGVISRRRFERDPEIGDVHEFTLRGQEDGLWALELSGRGVLSTWEDMEPGSLVQARVQRCAHGGLELKIGPLHAFLPKSHTGLARDEDPAVLVGRTLTCEVLEVDRERQRAVVSHKLVLQRERESEREREVHALRPGQVVQARVTRLEPYGAFLTFGRGIQGLAHVSDLTFQRLEHPAELLSLGQVVDAKVLSIKSRGRRIALGLKQVGENPWRRVEHELHEGALVEGTITRVREFGAFVALSCGVEGLLPLSECGLHAGQGSPSVLSSGRRVSLRVVALDAEKERLTLSLLHRTGARIEPGEAAAQRSFEELVREATPRAGPGQLGRKLAEAFGLQRRRPAAGGSAGA